jgi:Beta-lactamase enzyme family
MRLAPQLAKIRYPRLVRGSTAQRAVVAGALTVLWILPLLLANTVVDTRARAVTLPKARAGGQSTPAAQGAWAGITQTTDAPYTLPSNASQLPGVDPQFKDYYSEHNGSAALGTPLTPAYPIQEGIVQFFSSGALLAPRGKPSSHGHQDGPMLSDISQLMYSDGLADSGTGIVELPMLHALLTLGSKAPIGGDASSMTYADLRASLVTVNVVPDASPSDPSMNHTALAAQPLFAVQASGTRFVTRHLIADAFWQYITQPDVSPTGWQQEFGLPLTPALTLFIRRGTTTHEYLLQAFWRGALLLDQDTASAGTRPVVERVHTGASFLQTLGPPGADVQAGASVWVRGSVALLSAPQTGSARVHLGQNFQLYLTGASRWVNGTLWYEASWHSVGASGAGWVEAANVTATPPGQGAPTYASFDAFSPSLAAYLAGFGGRVGAMLYDETRQQYYTYNPDGQFTVASSVKVPIMLTLLTMIEGQGRDVNDGEMYLLTTMIENSNNDSAQALWEEVGGVNTVTSFLRGVGIQGFSGNPDAWGYSTISPRAMVQLLTLLHEGKILTPQHRALALSLMESIEPDQQTGAGDTAPVDATVAMKDGWVPGPDGLWAMNTSGIITVGDETYIISVYTQDDDSLDDGWAITRTVCGTVAKILG